MSGIATSINQPGELIDGHKVKVASIGPSMEHPGVQQGQVQPLTASTPFAMLPAIPQEVVNLWQRGLPQGNAQSGSLPAGNVNSWQPTAVAGTLEIPQASVATQATKEARTQVTQPSQQIEGSFAVGTSDSAAGTVQNPPGQAYKKRGRPLGSKNRKTLEKEALAAGLPLPIQEPAPKPQAAGQKRRGRPPGSKTKKKHDTGAPDPTQLSPLNNLLPCFPVIVSAPQSDPLPPAQAAAPQPAATPAGSSLPSGLAGAAPAGVNIGPGLDSNPQQDSSGSVRPIELPSKEELLQRFGPDILARYPELLGRFKVPGRKPGRPPGSKTVNKRPPGEPKPPARPLESGKRRGRPPGRLNKATYIKMGAAMTPNATSVDIMPPSAPSAAAAAAAGQLSGSGTAAQPQAVASAVPAASPAHVPGHSTGSGLADLVPKTALTSTPPAVDLPVPAV